MSEVRQEGDLKFLYKLKVDESALKKRNIYPRLTDYRKQLVTQAQLSSGDALSQPLQQLQDTSKKQPGFFESEFDKEKKDTVINLNPAPASGAAATSAPVLVSSTPEEEPVLKNAKLLDYHLKFSVDNLSAGFNNDVLINRYQPYTASLPITLGQTNSFNAMFKASVFDLFEDIRFTGAIRLPLFSGSNGAIGVGSDGGSLYVPANSSFLTAAANGSPASIT